jgi:hypothetical protein
MNTVTCNVYSGSVRCRSIGRGKKGESGRGWGWRTYF